VELGLNGKKVFITGGTRGIGLATAKAFLCEGSDIYLNGHNASRLQAVCKKLKEETGNEVVSCLGDITSAEAVGKLCETLQTDSLDIAVMNLGSGKAENKNGLAADEWRRFYEINTISAVNVLNQLYPLLKRGKNANVVLVSSVVARERSAAPVAYAAAKGAILTLCRYLSSTWAGDGIRVNAVLPGNVYFPGGRWEEIMAEDKVGTLEYIHRAVPMNRFGKPEEIADAVLFLASERAAFITGAMLNVDGGQQSAI
jgi:3-oxoacyl-[acyl-carrier protein] reductase